MVTSPTPSSPTSRRLECRPPPSSTAPNLNCWSHLSPHAPSPSAAGAPLSHHAATPSLAAPPSASSWAPAAPLLDAIPCCSSLGLWMRTSSHCSAPERARLSQLVCLLLACPNLRACYLLVPTCVLATCLSQLISYLPSPNLRACCLLPCSIIDCPYNICRHLSNNKLMGSISPKLVHIPRLTYLWVFLSSWFFYVYTFLAFIWFWYCHVTMVCDRYLDNNNFIGRIP
jgi:hypothetical protein